MISYKKREKDFRDRDRIINDMKYDWMIMLIWAIWVLKN